MDMGQKIYKLRTENGLTLEELGNMVGVGKSTVRKWENGIIANMKRDKILKVSEALGTSPAYLMGWNEEETAAPQNPPPKNPPPEQCSAVEHVQFPLLGAKHGARPGPAGSTVEACMMAGSSLQADFCLRATGDSMANDRICDGDIVFIKKQETVNHGELAAVIIDNRKEPLLKRVFYYQDNSLLVLRSADPGCEEYVFSREEFSRVQILGKAVAFFSTIP